MPEISVIVPVYNASDFLSECIESILAQTFKDFELIIVDDGSTDESAEICEKYSKTDSRIRIIHQKNSGVSVARNSGINYSTGRWISFIDSDDWVDSNYLLNFNIKDDFPDLIIQGLKYVNNVNHTIRNKISYPANIKSNTETLGFISKYDILSSGYPVGKCFSRDIINQFNIRFKEDISYHEDHIFVFEYLLASKAISLREGSLYNYRFSHNNTSLSRKPHSADKLLTSSVLMFDYFIKLIKKYGIEDKKYIRKIGTYCLSPRFSPLWSPNYGYAERHKILSNLVKDSDIIYRYYYPKGLLNKTIKYLLCLKSVSLANMSISIHQSLKKLL